MVIPRFLNQFLNLFENGRESNARERRTLFQQPVTGIAAVTAMLC